MIQNYSEISACLDDWQTSTFQNNSKTSACVNHSEASFLCQSFRNVVFSESPISSLMWMLPARKHCSLKCQISNTLENHFVCISTMQTCGCQIRHVDNCHRNSSCLDLIFNEQKTFEWVFVDWFQQPNELKSLSLPARSLNWFYKRNCNGPNIFMKISTTSQNAKEIKRETLTLHWKEWFC